jgi:hypothetical protein
MDQSQLSSSSDDYVLGVEVEKQRASHIELDVNFCTNGPMKNWSFFENLRMVSFDVASFASTSQPGKNTRRYENSCRTKRYQQE